MPIGDGYAIEILDTTGTAVRTYIGQAYGDRQCPVWLPQDPNVPHNQRTRCVRWGPHGHHTDTYLIEEQTLD